MIPDEDTEKEVWGWGFVVWGFAPKNLAYAFKEPAQFALAPNPKHKHQTIITGLSASRYIAVHTRY
jgi:hypothetical protein